MSNAWPYEFHERMRRFEGRREPRHGELAVSIKIRVSSGCFHREHSPRAYEIIDQRLRSFSATSTALGFEEHESGPEILAYVLLTAAGINLAAAVINLVTAIIKARSEGIKKGDHPSDPLCLIVRRVHDADGIREEQVLTIGHKDAIEEAKLEEQITTALHKLLEEREPTKRSKPATGPALQKKKGKKRNS